MMCDTHRRRDTRALHLILAVLLPLGVAVIACGGSVESRLAEVRALQAAGQFSESIDPLREILAESPDLAEANHLLGVSLVQTGQASLAVWSLEKAARDPEYTVTSGLLLASTFLSLSNYEEAVRAADRVLEQAPDRASALQVRAHANLGAGRRDESLADTKRLLQTDPDGYQPNLFHAVLLAELDRLDESEKAHERVREIAAASGDPGVTAKGCLALAKFYEDNRKDAARAEATFLECVDANPGDPFAVNMVMGFLDKKKKRAEATELVRRAVKEAPQNLQLRSQLAARLRGAGDAAAGEAVLVEAAETLGTPAAWSTLSGYRRNEGNIDGALEAIEIALERATGEPDRLRFHYADLLVEAGRLDQAAEVGKSLKEPSYRDLILGRVLLERGDAKGALAAFEAGIRRWPNNAGARYSAGVAAQKIGDVKRAISEFREAIRVDPKATDAALLLAHVQLQIGEPGNALNSLGSFLDNRDPRNGDAIMIGIRALTRLRRYEEAGSAIDRLVEIEGKSPRAIVARATVAAAADGSDAGIRIIERSGLDLADPKNEEALRWQVVQLVEKERYDSALGRVVKALERAPKQASLHELQGAVLTRAGRTQDARRSFQSALELDPDHSRSLQGLATVEVSNGDLAEGLKLATRAAQADPTNIVAAYMQAQLYLATGDSKQAEKGLRRVLITDPGHAGARNDLAWLLAERGESLDEALALAESARRLNDRPEVLDTLGWVHFRRGEFDAATEVLEQAVAGLPDSGSVRYRLGLALAKQGETKRAQTALKRALDAGPFPEADAARRELALLEKR